MPVDPHIGDDWTSAHTDPAAELAALRRDVRRLEERVTELERANDTAKPTDNTRHPVQPLIFDGHGVKRFKANAIVRYLLDAGPNNMNTLAVMPFSPEDRCQFAQLIGYSLNGYGELSYVSPEEWDRIEDIDP